MRSATVKQLEQTLFQLNSRISTLLYMVDSDCDNIDYDRNDEEEALLAEEFRGIIDKLCSINSKLSYLQKPITETSTLRKNDLGRYEMKSGHYFTSGSPIEAFIFDAWDETYRWVISRIEHKNGDYYLYRYDDVKLEGLKVRVRG